MKEKLGAAWSNGLRLSFLGIADVIVSIGDGLYM